MDKNLAISVNPEINEMVRGTHLLKEIENFVSYETKNIVDVLLALIGLGSDLIDKYCNWNQGACNDHA